MTYFNGYDDGYRGKVCMYHSTHYLAGYRAGVCAKKGYVASLK